MVRRDVTALWDWLHNLTPQAIERSIRILENASELKELLMHFLGWLQFMQFKAESVVGFYRRVRQLTDELGYRGKVLAARGWCPPWNRSRGIGYRALTEVCDKITPKLFTFDHNAMPRWYGQTLLTWKPELSESRNLDALIVCMNLPDDIEHQSFVSYDIPAPTEEHPAKLEAYQNRLDELVDQVDGKAPCYPISHLYLLELHWKRMVTLIRESRVDGMWVNMYGYLTDQKLIILGRI